MWDKDKNQIKLLGLIKAVVCDTCHLVQDINEVNLYGRCTAEKVSKGWNKCQGKEFWEI